MEKLKPIKTLDQAVLSKNHASNLTDPSAFDPVLSKISQKSLLQMFENDIALSLKAIKFNSSSNNQKLLNMDLFLSAWKKYGCYLPPLLYATKLVESGEELIQYKGFHNLANSHCFSKLLEINDQAEEVQMARLIVRAKYGRAMTNYIQILSMDPLIKSPTGDELIEEILCELLEIMDGCSKKEELAGLLLTGSYHIRNICNHLAQNKSFSLSAEYLSKSVKYLDDSIELTGGEFIPWLVDNVKATYDSLFNLSLITEANKIVVSTISRIRMIEELEKEAKYTDVLPKDIQDDINAALYEMNLLLFGCEVRAMTPVIYRGTAQSSSYFALNEGSNGGMESETLLTPVASISSRKSSKQLWHILKMQIDRLCDSSTAKSLYKIKLGAYASTFEENPKYNQEIKNMADSYIEENRINIDILEDTAIDSDPNVIDSKEQIEQELNKSQKKVSKKDKQEIADDLKAKKQEFKQLISRLQMFSDDRGKLAAINVALYNLGLNGNSLQTYSKCTEPVLEKYIKHMILFGVFLLTSPSGSLDGHITMKKMIEVKKGKLTDIQSLPRCVDLQRFHLDDVINFSRYLYVQEYWGYFLRLALNNEISRENGFCNYQNELALRSRCIKFDISFHADRMVGFDYSQQEISKSLSDLHKKRQKVGKYVEKAIIAFIREASICLADETTCNRNISLLIDTSFILWKYVEPYFLDLDASKPNETLFFEPIVVSTIHAAYIISSQIYNPSNLFVTISTSYAQYLEIKSIYQESIDILLDAIKHLKVLKMRLGENCSPFINSLLEEKSIDSESQGKMLVKLLACDHVELLEAYYRCYIKLHYAKTIEDVKTREEQHFRLTQKKIKIDPLFRESDLEQFMKHLCGESHSHRAVFLLVFSCNALHYDLSIRKKCIILSYKYLRQAVDYEKYLKEISTAKENTHLSLAFRSHNCVAVRVSASDSGAFARLFCSLSSVNKMVSIKNSKFAGTGESVTLGAKKEVLIFISGLDSYTLYEFSGNLENSKGDKMIQLPRINVITGSMLPLILCWENFSMIAPTIGYLNLGLNGLKFLWSYFVETPFTPENSIKNVLPKQPSPLKQEHIARESPSILRNFIKVILYLNEEEYEPILKTYLDDLSDNSLYYSLNDFRFRAIERSLVALELSKNTANPQFELKSAVKCLIHTESIIKTNSQNPVAIPILSLIHASLMHSIYTLKNNRAQGIVEYVIPTTTYLVKLFTNLKMYEHMFKICTETLETIHRYCVVSDLKIKNVLDDRFSRTGVAPDSNLRNLSNSQEFVHHEYLATSDRWRTGYNMKKTVLDTFCEYLEAQIITSCFKLPLYLENALVGEVLKKELARRSLDSQPTMKEIQILFENSQSPDLVFHEALRFRKNSRFVEIASMVARWSLSISNFEQASKICGDIEDWCSKRNLILTTGDLSPEEAQKWEALIKRKKNLLKGDKKPETETKIEKRGRTTDRSKPMNTSISAQNLKKKKHIKDEHSKRPHSGERESISSRERNERSASPDLSASQRMRLSSKDVGPSGKKQKESQIADTDPQSSYIAYRRRKLTKKQQYYDGLTPEMRAKTDKAAKILDKRLSSLWYKSRMRKRLKVVLTFEAPSRVDIAFLHAESIFGILKKDLNQKGIAKKEALDIDTLSKNGISVPANWGIDEAEKNVTFSIQLSNSIKDIFQYYSTGIKLAARYGLWLKLLLGIQQLVDMYKYFEEIGAFDSSIWKDRLSEFFYYAADDISDCLQIATFSAENSLTPYASTLEHVAAPIIDKKFPAQSQEDIFDHSWNILYKDIQGVIHAESINLSFIIKFLQLSLEILDKAKKFDRHSFLFNRLNNIFPGCDLFMGQASVAMVDEKSSHKFLYAAKRATNVDDRVALYESALLKAEKEDCVVNVLVSLHEMGNALCQSKDIKGAVTKWMKCIDLVFMKENILFNWPKIFSFNLKADRLTELLKASIEILKITRNAKLSVLMGLIISKLAHYGFSNDECLQNHMNLFAVACLVAPFAIIPPRASTYLDFSSYESTAVGQLLESFSLQYSHPPGAILKEVLWMIDHSIASRTPDLIPPLVCFINHISQGTGFSSVYQTITKCAQIQALQLLKMPKEAFSIISSIKNDADPGSLSFEDIFRNKGRVSEFLDLSPSEAAKGIYSQALISVEKAKFLIDSWLSKERSQGAISEATTYVLQQQKKIYSQKLQLSLMDRLFYDRIEIWWNILLGDLSFLAGNIGLSIKWYFTAMEGLQLYSSGRRNLGPIEYGFVSLKYLRLLIFQKATVSFIALRHFDVANHIARAARRESESLGMKVHSTLFYSLEMASATERINPTLPQENEVVTYMHTFNFEIISGAFETMIDCAFDGLSGRNFNYDPFVEFSSISKKFPYGKEDLLRIKMKHFLSLRLRSDVQSIQSAFAEIQDLYNSYPCSQEMTRNYLLTKVRNSIDLVQANETSPSVYLGEAKEIMLEFLSKVITDHTFAYGHIRASLLMLASIELLQNGQPAKWIYLATKLAMLRNHYKLHKKLAFDLNIGNLSKELLYDLEIFNYKNSLSTNGLKLPYPLESDTLENVLKFSDQRLAIPETNVADEDIFEIVTILEDELLDPYKPVSDPWKVACQDRLKQILLLADTDYKWDIQPSNLDSPVPAAVFCIQWLETRQPLESSLTSNQANLYKLHFCVSDQQHFTSTGLVSKNVLESLVQKTESLVLNLKRSYQIPDVNFIKKATESWNSLLDKFISFFNADKSSLKDIKYLEPTIPLVECLMKSLSISQGHGYGADLTNLCPDSESSKIFFEWVLNAIAK